MTKEEAIKELERTFDVLDHSCHMDNRRKEAFNMARVALFAEPCEDAISMSVIENIKAEINEFIKNPQFGDLSIGASCGAVRCLEIINRHLSGKESE